MEKKEASMVDNQQKNFPVEEKKGQLNKDKNNIKQFSLDDVIIENIDDKFFVAKLITKSSDSSSDNDNQQIGEFEVESKEDYDQIMTMNVNKEYQRKGVGSLILKEILKIYPEIQIDMKPKTNNSNSDLEEYDGYLTHEGMQFIQKCLDKEIITKENLLNYEDSYNSDDEQNCDNQDDFEDDHFEQQN